MKRLDAYARITAGEAARLAAGAVAGIMADRRRQAEKAVEAYRCSASAPRWWRPWRGPERTTEETRRCLEAVCRSPRVYLDDLEYDFLRAANLHGDALHGAKALSDAAGQDADGVKLGDRDILINPEDMLELRALAAMARPTDARDSGPAQAGPC